MPDIDDEEGEIARVFDEETGGTGRMTSNLTPPYGQGRQKAPLHEVDPNHPENSQIKERGSRGPRNMIEILAGKPPT